VIREKLLLVDGLELYLLPASPYPHCFLVFFCDFVIFCELKLGLLHLGLLYDLIELRNLGVEFLEEVNNFFKGLWCPIRAVGEESRHRNVLFVNLLIVLPDQLDYSVFFLGLNLLAVHLVVKANLLAPKYEGVDAIQAHPAMVLVVVGLHAPLATERNVHFVPQDPLNRHVGGTGLYRDFTQLIVHLFLVHRRQAESLLDELGLSLL